MIPNPIRTYAKQIWARKVLVTLEIIGGVCHLLFFIIVMVVLIVLAPRSSNEFVWKTMIKSSPGWTNPGAAFCIGLLSPTFVVSGFDGVLHMSMSCNMFAIGA
jgi:choline transport protein